MFKLSSQCYLASALCSRQGGCSQLERSGSSIRAKVSSAHMAVDASYQQVEFRVIHRSKPAELNKAEIIHNLGKLTQPFFLTVGRGEPTSAAGLNTTCRNRRHVMSTRTMPIDDDPDQPGIEDTGVPSNRRLITIEYELTNPSSAQDKAVL